MRRSLGLDWGAGEARWVELVEERGHPTVRAFGTVEVPSREGGAIEALRTLVAQHRWRGREVVAAMDRSAVTLAWLTLPVAAREDLAAMVELEAAQTLPFPVEEAAWDFAAGPGSDGSQSVLLVAARRQFVEEKRRRLEAAGLRLGALTVDVLATATLARAAAGEGTEGAVVARLDPGGVTLS
jgi:type IV pilus assembly protein PilM